MLEEITIFSTSLLPMVVVNNLREGWAGVDEQLLEVGLEPGTGFRGGYLEKVC